MPISPPDQSKINEFLADIEPFKSAYRFPTFHFIAILCKDQWVLFHGAVELNVTPRELSEAVETEHVLAGEMLLPPGSHSLSAFLEQLSEGSFRVTDRALLFPPDLDGSHHPSSRFFNGSSYGPAAAGELILRSANNFHHFIQQPNIARELRTSHAAFNSFAQLAAHYGMQFSNDTNLHIIVHAPAVMEILPESQLARDKISVAIRLNGQLSPDLARISMRAAALEAGDNPLTADIRWGRSESGDWHGDATADAPNVITVDCVLSYAGFLQEERTITEPPALRDTLRLAYETFAPEKDAFARVIDDFKITNRDGRELESVVAALLAYCGLRVVALDRIPGLQDIPDIVAVDPDQNVLLVECSLKLPNAENKFERLAHRRDALRGSLNKAGLATTKLFAVLATTQPYANLAQHVDDACKAGVLLWGREDLHALNQQVKSELAPRIVEQVEAQFSFMQI